MTAEQILAILCTLADLKIAVDRLAAENEHLRQALAQSKPAEQ